MLHTYFLLLLVEYALRKIEKKNPYSFGCIAEHLAEDVTVENERNADKSHYRQHKNERTATTERVLASIAHGANYWLEEEADNRTEKVDK